jgi:DNA-binding IclR family transcriptional regulator
MSLHRRVHARDRGLRRVSRLTSLTLTGGLAISGGFAAVAAHAYAGHSRRSTRSSTGAVTQPGSTASGASLLAPSTTTTTAVVPLGAPQTAPQTAPSTTATTVPQTVPQTVPYYAPVPPPVVSGGS